MSEETNKEKKERMAKTITSEKYYIKEEVCPVCNKPLKTWYCACGGGEYIGCSDILCEYQAVKKEK